MRQSPRRKEIHHGKTERAIHKLPPAGGGHPETRQKSLTQQLRELEGHKIIKRKVYAEIPPRVEYSLTEHGLRLRGILDAMNGWAHDYAAAEHITVHTWAPPEEE